MNKEATIKSALIPFLKDADIRKAMDIFHKDYADITPYQIQRFVHEITQDNATKEYRSNIRRSLMKALSDYQMGAGNPNRRPMISLIWGKIVQQFTHHPVK